MSDPETEDTRLDRIERPIRTLRWSVVILAILVGIATVILVLRGNERIIVAEHIAVKNAVGDFVAVLSTGSNGLPYLAFFNEQRKMRLFIGLDKDGSGALEAFAPDGTIRWKAPVATVKEAPAKD